MTVETPRHCRDCGGSKKDGQVCQVGKKRMRAGERRRMKISCAVDSSYIEDALQPRRLLRSEEHTSELQSLMRISYAVFCLKKKKKKNTYTRCTQTRITK